MNKIGILDEQKKPKSPLNNIGLFDTRAGLLDAVAGHNQTEQTLSHHHDIFVNPPQ
jgi:hypothetical protein